MTGVIIMLPYGSILIVYGHNPLLLLYQLSTKIFDILAITEYLEVPFNAIKLSSFIAPSFRTCTRGHFLWSSGIH